MEYTRKEGVTVPRAATDGKIRRPIPVDFLLHNCEKHSQLLYLTLLIQTFRWGD